MNLRTPGPTPLPPPVREALARDMVDHRGPKFADVLRSCTATLQRLFLTSNDLLVLTASGTGGLESAVVNLLSPGERVLAVSIGAFGKRFAQIAEVFGADVVRLEFAQGEAADPAAVARALADDPSITTVLVTHNETSTGVTNDLEAITRVVRDADRLLVVDAISSIGSIPLETDAWGCDVVISGSQKSWMIPPGLVMVSVSPRAWQAHAAARMPRFYWDWTEARRYAEKGQTPWTPAVGLLFALREALRMMEEEGLPAVLARHHAVATHVRSELKAIGLRLLARDERRASDTVTAFWLPEGVAAGEVQRRLRDEHGVVLAGGQEDLAGKILRIGHLGYVDVPAVDVALAALRAVLAVAVPA